MTQPLQTGGTRRTFAFPYTRLVGVAYYNSSTDTYGQPADALLNFGDALRLTAELDTVARPATEPDRVFSAQVSGGPFPAQGTAYVSVTILCDTFFERGPRPAPLRMYVYEQIGQQIGARAYFDVIKSDRLTYTVLYDYLVADTANDLPRELHFVLPAAENPDTRVRIDVFDAFVTTYPAGADPNYAAVARTAAGANGATAALTAAASSAAGTPFASAALQDVGSRLTAVGIVSAAAVNPAPPTGVTAAATATGASVAGLVGAATITAGSSSTALGLLASAVATFTPSGITGAATGAGQSIAAGNSAPRLTAAGAVTATGFATGTTSTAPPAGVTGLAFGNAYTISPTAGTATLRAAATVTPTGRVAAGAITPTAAGVVGAVAATGRTIAAAVGTANLTDTGSRIIAAGTAPTTFAEAVATLTGAVESQVRTIVAVIGQAVGQAVSDLLVRGGLAEPLRATDGLTGALDAGARAEPPARIFTGPILPLEAEAFTELHIPIVFDAAPAPPVDLIGTLRAIGDPGGLARLRIAGDSRLAADAYQFDPVIRGVRSFMAGTSTAEVDVARVRIVPPSLPGFTISAAGALNAFGATTLPFGNAVLSGTSAAFYNVQSAPTFFAPAPLEGTATVTVLGAKIQNIAPGEAAGAGVAILGGSGTVALGLFGPTAAGLATLRGRATLLVDRATAAIFTRQAHLAGTSSILTISNLLVALLRFTAPKTAIGATATLTVNTASPPTSAGVAVCAGVGRLEAAPIVLSMRSGTAALYASGAVTASLATHGPGRTTLTPRLLEARGRLDVVEFFVYGDRTGGVPAPGAATVLAGGYVAGEDSLTAAPYIVGTSRLEAAAQAFVIVEALGRARLEAAGRNIPARIILYADLWALTTVRADGTQAPLEAAATPPLEAVAALNALGEARSLNDLLNLVEAPPILLEAAAELEPVLLAHAGAATLRGTSTLERRYPGTAELRAGGVVEATATGTLSASGSYLMPVRPPRIAATGHARSAPGVSPTGANRRPVEASGATASAAGNPDPPPPA